MIGSAVDIQALGGFLHYARIHQPAEKVEGCENVLILLAAIIVVVPQQMAHVFIAVAMPRQYIKQHRVRDAELRRQLLRLSLSKARKGLFGPRNLALSSGLFL